MSAVISTAATFWCLTAFALLGGLLIEAHRARQARAEVRRLLAEADAERAARHAANLAAYDRHGRERNR